MRKMYLHVPHYDADGGGRFSVVLELSAAHHTNTVGQEIKIRCYLE